MAELRVIRKTQCGGCKKYFGGDSAFFAHRTGEYNKRRCLSTEEMIAQGYASERLLVKMYLENKPIREEHDVWYIIADREAVRQAFGRASPTEDEDEE